MSDIISQYKLVTSPIYSHCFSQDRSILAITCETNCYIYKVQGTTQPQLLATLSDHEKIVTAVDISIHGRIVTCSQDRNAIVWEPLSDGTYRATLVLLRINRAATCVNWAPNGYKFSVGSSARIISVCYYEQENNWWVSKHIKKPIKSTVNCISWHSNGILLAVGGTDGYVRIFSGFIKGLDSKDQVVNSPWGEKFPFGSLVREWYEGTWIHDVKWRSSIEKLGFVSHNGTLNVVDSYGEHFSVDNPKGLPFKSLCWINDYEIACAGYSCRPILFTEGSFGWNVSKILDEPNTRVSSQINNDEEENEEQNFGISALKKFKELDLKGKITAQDERPTHENTIMELASFRESQGNVTQFSSCGLDGKIVIYRV